MTTITFVAGMRGVGKSTLLEIYGKRAVAIEAEEVQAQAVKLAKGPDCLSPYEWDVWDEDLISRAKELLRQAMKILYPDLKPNNKPLLIVGAFLVKDWFSQAFIEVLNERFPCSRDDPKFCILHLDATTISNQIEKRGRQSEADYVGKLDKISKERDGYLNMASVKWQKFTSHKELQEVLESRM